METPCSTLKRTNAKGKKNLLDKIMTILQTSKLVNQLWSKIMHIILYQTQIITRLQGIKICNDSTLFLQPQMAKKEKQLLMMLNLAAQQNFNLKHNLILI